MVIRVEFNIDRPRDAYSAKCSISLLNFRDRDLRSAHKEMRFCSLHDHGWEQRVLLQLSMLSKRIPQRKEKEQHSNL